MIFKITIKLALLIILFSSRISYSQNLIFENIIDTIISMDYEGFNAINNSDNPFEIEINIPENKIWKIKNIIFEKNLTTNLSNIFYYHSNGGGYTGPSCSEYFTAAKISNGIESTIIFKDDFHNDCTVYHSQRKSDELDIWVRGSSSKTLIFGVYPKYPQFVLQTFKGKVFLSVQQYYID